MTNSCFSIESPASTTVRQVQLHDSPSTQSFAISDMQSKNKIQTHNPEVRGSPPFVGTGESSPRDLNTKKGPDRVPFCVSGCRPRLVLVTRWTGNGRLFPTSIHFRFAARKLRSRACRVASRAKRRITQPPRSPERSAGERWRRTAKRLDLGAGG